MSHEWLSQRPKWVLWIPHILSTSITSLIDGTKIKLARVSEKNELSRQKNLFLGAIIGTGTIQSNFLVFHDLFQEGEISEREIKEALRIYLNTKTLNVYSKLSLGTMKEVDGKMQKVQIALSSLSQIEKILLAYGLKNKKITQSMTEYLHFDNNESVLYYIEHYGQWDLITQYFAQLLIDVREYV